MPEYSILTKKSKMAFCQTEQAPHKLFKQGDSKMTEEKKEARTVIVTSRDTADTISTLIGFGRGAETVYEIVWLIPTTDEAALERYNATLQDLVVLGVRNLTTKPQYHLEGFDEAGNLLENGHELMQEIADSYKVGARKVSVKTAEQRQLESVLANKGMTMAELIEKAKDL